MLNVEWVGSSRGSTAVILSRQSHVARKRGVAEDGEGSQATRPVLKPGFNK